VIGGFSDPFTGSIKGEIINLSAVKDRATGSLSMRLDVGDLYLET
jgi:hypothetical protein